MQHAHCPCCVQFAVGVPIMKRVGSANPTSMLLCPNRSFYVRYKPVLLLCRPIKYGDRALELLVHIALVAREFTTYRCTQLSCVCCLTAPYSSLRLAFGECDFCLHVCLHALVYALLETAVLSAGTSTRLSLFVSYCCYSTRHLDVHGWVH